MKIINPLYDTAFKYLMENNRLAKKVLSVILDEEIDELVVGQQETTVLYSSLQISLFRLDFKATIRMSDGARKTVLIELQKSKFPSDLQRFRNYLAATYLTKESEPAIVKEPIPGMLPIITIYILGYNLEDLPYLAVRVNNDVVNAINGQRVEVKSFFIEHLTHRAHIIQVNRLPLERRTRLEQFLVLFNQEWCASNSILIDLKDVPEEFADIASYLQAPVMDEDFRRHLLAEQELDGVFGKQMAEKEELKRQVLQEQQIIRKLVQTLQKKGFSQEEISRQSGIKIEDLNIEDYIEGQES
jgi:hypothetical protein